jgi:hypothetical protein
MLDARVPRITIDIDRRNKLNDIDKQVNKELFDELIELDNKYMNIFK